MIRVVTALLVLAAAGDAGACTIVFTKDADHAAFRLADLVVTAQAVDQRFSAPEGGVAQGEAVAVVKDVQKGRVRPGQAVTYHVQTGNDGLCPAMWSTEPGRLYRLYLKKRPGGGPMQIVHRIPHFGP